MLLLGLTLSFLAPVARADYTVSIGQNDISVEIRGVFAQGVPNSAANNTADIFANIPVFHTIFESDNATGLTKQLNDAITSKSPSVKVSQVSLIVNSNGTRLDYDMRFSVQGAISYNGAFEKVDLAWRSFTISDEVLAGTISLNKVFPTYIQNQIQSFAAQGPGTQLGGQLFWYFNNRRVTYTLIPQVTKGLLLFDFQRLNTQLEDWHRTNDLQDASITLRAEAGFNVTFIQQISESTETVYFANDAVYTVDAVIRAPLTTSASGDRLSFEGPGAFTQYVLMTTIPFSLLALLVATFVAERRYSRRSVPGKLSKRTKKVPS